LDVSLFFFRARVLMAARLNRRLELQEGMVRAHIPTLGQPLYTPEELWDDQLPAGAYEGAVLVQGQSLYLRLRRDEAVQYREMHIARPVTLSESIAPILRGQMMSLNTVYSMDIYEPLWGGSAGQVQVSW